MGCLNEWGGERGGGGEGDFSGPPSSRLDCSVGFGYANSPSLSQLIVSYSARDKYDVS